MEAARFQQCILGFVLCLLTLFVFAQTVEQPEQVPGIQITIYLDRVTADQLRHTPRHIGNYREETLALLIDVAEKMEMSYFTSEPHSEACSRPGAVCSWDEGMRAMHFYSHDLQEYWNTFCEEYPEHIFCQN